MQKSGRIPAVLVLVLALAGCSGPDTAAAESTAAAFEAALAQGDAETACALLTPQAAAAVAEEEGADCAQAIVSLGLTAGRGDPRAEAYGQGAIVELDGDTVFLAASGDGWRVRAAGCVATTEDAPFDCRIDGS